MSEQNSVHIGDAIPQETIEAIKKLVKTGSGNVTKRNPNTPELNRRNHRKSHIRRK